MNSEREFPWRGNPDLAHIGNALPRSFAWRLGPRNFTAGQGLTCNANWWMAGDLPENSKYCSSVLFRCLGDKLVLVTY